MSLVFLLCSASLLGRGCIFIQRGKTSLVWGTLFSLLVLHPILRHRSSWSSSMVGKQKRPQGLFLTSGVRRVSVTITHMTTFFGILIQETGVETHYGGQRRNREQDTIDEGSWLCPCTWLRYTVFPRWADLARPNLQRCVFLSTMLPFPHWPDDWLLG